MSTIRRILCCLAFVAAAAAAQLAPGQLTRIPFPDLPETLAGGTPELHIQPPAGWNPNRAYPIMLWLNGGSGPPGVCGAYVTKPYILVSLPLFKDPKTRASSPAGGIYVVPADDAYVWKAWQPMLEKLDELVPNQDHERSIIGGYSNGAHTTSLLTRHPEIFERFAGFLINEGGDHFVCPKSMKGKKVIWVMGEKSIGQGRMEFHQEVLKAGGESLYLVMPNAGHVGPEGEYLKKTRDWATDTVYYAGLADGFAALQAAVKAKRWPQAITGYRFVAAVADESRPEWKGTQDALATIDGACADAAKTLQAREAKADELRKFIATWTPCPAAEALRPACESRAIAELPDAVKAGEQRLLKFDRDWTGYAGAQVKAVEALDAIAAKEYEAAPAAEDARLSALKRLVARLPMTPTAAKARGDVDAIAAKRLEPLLDEPKAQARVTKLQRFLREFPGIPSAERAAEAIAKANEEIAEKLLEAIKGVPDPKQRKTQLEALEQTYAGTKAAAAAAKLID
jgi:hypothetical protein